jgi:hypothetical protein
MGCEKDSNPNCMQYCVCESCRDAFLLRANTDGEECEPVWGLFQWAGALGGLVEQ